MAGLFENWPNFLHELAGKLGQVLATLVGICSTFRPPPHPLSATTSGANTSLLLLVFYLYERQAEALPFLARRLGREVGTKNGKQEGLLDLFLFNTELKL